jgi:hypothetical protein
MCTVADLVLSIMFAVKSLVPVFFQFSDSRVLRLQYRKITEAPRVGLYVRGALIASAIADVTIAAALCYYLRKFRTGFKR